MSSSSPSYETSGKARRREQAAATRAQLLAAARAVFEEKGYQAATVGAITARARTAHGTFYLYFRNKEDAFSAVVDDVVARSYAASVVDWDGDLRGSAEATIAGFLRMMVEHRGLWRCVLEAVLARPSFEEMWREFRDRYVTSMADGLAVLVAAGRVRPLDATTVAGALGAMVEWFAFTNLVVGERAADDVDALAATLADVWVHAVDRDA